MKKFAVSMIVVQLATLVGFGDSPVRAEEWTIPMAGNAFHTAPAPGGKTLRRDGVLSWSDPSDVYSVFFHVDRAVELRLSIRASARDGESVIQTRVEDNEFVTTVGGEEVNSHSIGTIRIRQPGYVGVDLQGQRREGETYAAIRELVVRTVDPDDELKVDYVRSNKGNMFYWGRRGPSVHLRYEVPRDVPLRYAYTEITVPLGYDPIGSFYMANGFGQGYFGFQVNGKSERRVLFSVWSPFKTDDPKSIPEDQRVVALAHGKDVRIGEFGNEGSGGQSFLVFSMEGGDEVSVPDRGRAGRGRQHDLHVMVRRGIGRPLAFDRVVSPTETDMHLRGFHSFLESFHPVHGHRERLGHYGNVWVGDVNGKWHECTQATFSVDATGRGRHRLDFDGGVRGRSFYLRNCGFFSGGKEPGQRFTRESGGADPPPIRPDSLPRGENAGPRASAP